MDKNGNSVFNIIECNTNILYKFVNFIFKRLDFIKALKI